MSVYVLIFSFELAQQRYNCKALNYYNKRDIFLKVQNLWLIIREGFISRYENKESFFI